MDRWARSKGARGGTRRQRRKAGGGNTVKVKPRKTEKRERVVMRLFSVLDLYRQTTPTSICNSDLFVGQ